MDGWVRDGRLVVGGDARQRFHDARGYGRPLSGTEIELAPVEAAHLLYREDLDAVAGREFRSFAVAAASGGLDIPVPDDFFVRFLVYKDLRERGFYLSPARPEWTTDGIDTDGVDLIVYPRGDGPGDGRVAHRIRTLGERVPVAADTLGDCTLAVVDEESEVSYFATERPPIAGDVDLDLPDGTAATLLSERIVCWSAPDRLHDGGFYGQPLGGRDEAGPLGLSLVEAAYLAARGGIAVDGAEAPHDDPDSAGYDAIVARGHETEGERFGRRLRTYADLRERGVAPKTGFKFGADFRTYAEVGEGSVGHSELLVRVVEPDHAFLPRDLALDVRLAHGVRKRMVFALVDDEPGTDPAYVAVDRLTP
ncbi:tRNA-intron lyase [Halobacteriales archaeon SW_7_68_16]|nr:MAG: tRNA-intron lyase [Halobacteriales archaeon SW_7_68_16]